MKRFKLFSLVLLVLAATAFNQCEPVYADETGVATKTTVETVVTAPIVGTPALPVTPPSVATLPQIPLPQSGQTPLQYITMVLLSLLGAILTTLAGLLIKYLGAKIKYQSLYEQDSLYRSVYRQGAAYANEVAAKGVKETNMVLSGVGKMTAAHNYSAAKLARMGVKVPEAQDIKDGIESVLGESR